MLHNNPQLKSLIDKLWNNFWSGGISNPLTAIEQITYLIFMKRLDDLEAKRERDAEFIGEKYKSRFSGRYKVPGSNELIDKKKLRWSEFKHFTADEMLLHIQTKVFPFLKELNGDASPFTHHMQNAVFIIPKASLLSEAIQIIESIFSEIERDTNEGGQAFQDVQGDVYEMLLGEIASAGKNGQFRTPRHIIKLIAELVAPQLGQKVADPACGTGGFLLGAYQFMLTDYIRKKDSKRIVPDEDGFERGFLSSVIDKKVKTILDDSFYGYDIDTTMVRLGLMNLMMHGIDEPHINYKDSLSKKFNEDGRYDIVLANPPFTGNIDEGDIHESLALPTTKSELLFVERIFNMLRMGGTAGVIVPQGVLFGSGKAFVTLRKKLLEEAELKAVITLPSGVFKPYAGVSTAILIFTKGGETKHTWFYELLADGYTLDDKRTKIHQSDLKDIVSRFHSRDPKRETKRTERGFFVPKREIVGDKPEESKYDLSLSKYKEEVYEEIQYESPKVILSRLQDLEKQIQKGLSELQKQI
ncbi:type I restriction-modification system subunit M [Leptospira interrogans]|uniref:type I restriction-modification system subunit M n=1 Tax=Leptospira interrogans TaxID=173 RepID=UPI0010C0D821|nr:DNA methyltransferase [Leptospira interrogans serovar Weerasinghe]QCO38148.1 SAM-dependent DNA methyltransferase [Leptospira interrogans]